MRKSKPPGTEKTQRGIAGRRRLLMEVDEIMARRKLDYLWTDQETGKFRTIKHKRKRKEHA